MPISSIASMPLVGDRFRLPRWGWPVIGVGVLAGGFVAGVLWHDGGHAVPATAEQPHTHLELVAPDAKVEFATINSTGELTIVTVTLPPAGVDQTPKDTDPTR